LNNSVELDVQSIESGQESEEIKKEEDDLAKEMIIDNDGDKSPIIVEEEIKDKVLDDDNSKPFIKEKEEEKILEPSCLLDDEEDVKDKVLDDVEIEVKKPEEKPVVSQSVDASIFYLEKLDKENLATFRENMIALMNMGFTDFEKNLDLLKKNYNDLNITMNQLLG